MHFQFCPLFTAQALPVVFWRDAHIPIIGWLAVLIGHFQEDEVGELFQIVAVAHAIIAQGVAEAPHFGNDTCCVVVFHHKFPYLSKPYRTGGTGGQHLSHSPTPRHPPVSPCSLPHRTNTTTILGAGQAGNTSAIHQRLVTRLSRPFSRGNTFAIGRDGAERRPNVSVRKYRALPPLRVIRHVGEKRIQIVPIFCPTRRIINDVLARGL